MCTMEPMETKENHDDVFNELMEHVGMNGKFQARFNYLFNLGFVMLVALPSFNIILALTLPEHWCHVPGRGETNLTLDGWKNLTIPRVDDTSTGEIYSKCTMYNLSLPVNLQAINDIGYNDTVSCQHGWDYDTTWYSLTAPSEENWVCDKEFYVPNSLLFTRIGEVAGTLIFGQMGDVIGRRPVMFLGVLALVLGRVVTAYTSAQYSVFLLANLVAGLPVAVVFQSPLIIGLEITSAARRASIAMLQCVGWTVGMCVMPFIAWVIGGEWKLFLVISSVPCAAVFLAIRTFPESPRWLAAKGESKKCLAVLNYIAKENGTSLPSNAEAILDKLAEKKEKIYGVASLFFNWRLIRNTFLISMSLSLTTILYYTLVLNVSTMSGNPFLNFFLQALVELPGFLIGGVICDRLGRRWSQVLCFFAAGIFEFACTAIVTHPDLQWLLISQVLVVKFCITVAGYCAYVQCMEIYPTCLRQTGTSVGFLIANALGLLGPYIVYLGTIADMRYPYAILGVLCVVGVVCTSLLPETLNQQLPETVQDAAHFGRDQKFWSLPKRRTNEDNEGVPTK